MALPKLYDPSQPRVQNSFGNWVVNPVLVQRLMINQRYDVQITLPNGQALPISFSSNYDPLYSSVTLIRQDLGDVLSAYTDDDINFKIYQISQLAQQLAGMAQRYILYGSTFGNIVLEFEGVARSDMQNAIPFPTPFYVQQYARYKTELELVYAIYIKLSTEFGLTEKDLGDFKVTRQVMLPRIKDILFELKQDLEEWEDQVRGGSEGKPKWTMRARYKDYPYSRTGKMGSSKSSAGGGGNGGSAS